jgi:hypothetical protein
MTIILRCAECTVDAYGDGEARETIEAQAVAARLPLNFLGKRDHLDPSLQAYQVGHMPLTASSETSFVLCCFLVFAASPKELGLSSKKSPPYLASLGELEGERTLKTIPQLKAHGPGPPTGVPVLLTEAGVPNPQFGWW